MGRRVGVAGDGREGGVHVCVGGEFVLLVERELLMCFFT